MYSISSCTVASPRLCAHALFRWGRFGGGRHGRVVLSATYGNPGAAEEAVHAVAGLGTLGDPGQRLVLVNHDLRRLHARIVVADNLDKAAIAGRTRIGHRRANANRPPPRGSWAD